MAAPPPSASEAVDPRLIARFAAGLAAAARRPVAADEPLALAVSGGADSMAMLALAAAARPGRVIAATFDHGLRAGSAAEADDVARWCAGRGIRHAILRPDSPISPRGLQAAARAARYAALGDWAAGEGAALLATAHHADDQAETFLMRAARAAGVAGLAGIRRQRPLGPVLLVRPLLDWRRAELAALAATLALPVADDPSNRDPRFARVRARNWLAARPAIDGGQLARAAAHIAELAADLDELGDWAWQARAVEDAVDVAGLPRALRRLLLRRLILATRARGGIARPAFGRDAPVEPLLDALERGGRATQGGVVVTPRGTRWTAAPAPPRRDAGCPSGLDRC